MARKSTVSAAKKKTKSAARPRAKRANVKLSSKLKESANTDTSSKVKKANVNTGSKVKRANVKLSSAVKGANIPGAQAFDATAISANQSPSLSTVSAAIDTPYQEQIEVEQQAVANSPDGANIYDPLIGYGTALPGESGVAAVDRIKSERKGRKSKVSKKKKK